MVSKIMEELSLFEAALDDAYPMKSADKDAAAVEKTKPAKPEKKPGPKMEQPRRPC
jgi:hypothetical protein